MNKIEKKNLGVELLLVWLISRYVTIGKGGGRGGVTGGDGSGGSIRRTARVS